VFSPTYNVKNISKRAIYAAKGKHPGKKDIPKRPFHWKNTLKRQKAKYSLNSIDLYSPLYLRIYVLLIYKNNHIQIVRKMMGQKDKAYSGGAK